MSHSEHCWKRKWGIWNPIVLACRYQLCMLSDADPCCGSVLTSFKTKHHPIYLPLAPTGWSVGLCLQGQSGWDMYILRRKFINTAVRCLQERDPCCKVSWIHALLSGFRLGLARDDEYPMVWCEKRKSSCLRYTTQTLHNSNRHHRSLTSRYTAVSKAVSLAKGDSGKRTAEVIACVTCSQLALYHHMDSG